MSRPTVDFVTWYNVFVATMPEIPSNLKKVIYATCQNAEANELISVVKLASMPSEDWKKNVQEQIPARVLNTEDCTVLRKFACSNAGLDYGALRAYYKNTGNVNLDFLDDVANVLSINRKNQKDLLLYTIQHGSLDFLFRNTNSPQWKKDLDTADEEDEEEEEPATQDFMATPDFEEPTD